MEGSWLLIVALWVFHWDANFEILSLRSSEVSRHFREILVRTNIKRSFSTRLAKFWRHVNQVSFGQIWKSLNFRTHPTSVCLKSTGSRRCEPVMQHQKHTIMVLVMLLNVFYHNWINHKQKSLGTWAFDATRLIRYLVALAMLGFKLKRSISSKLRRPFEDTSFRD